MAVKFLVLISLLHIMNVESASIAGPKKSFTTILFDDKSLDSVSSPTGSSGVTSVSVTGNGDKMYQPSQTLESSVESSNKKPVFKYVSDQQSKSKKYSRKPTILSNLDDMNQNWGILVNSSTLMDYDDEEIYRPIYIPKAKDLEEGSLSEIVANNNKFQGKALIAKTKPKEESFIFGRKYDEQVKDKPTLCDMTLMLCCTKNTDLQKCFTSRGCFIEAAQYKYENICDKKQIDRLLDKITKYYVKKDT